MKLISLQVESITIPLTNAVGQGDSVVTLDPTIHNSTATNDSAVAGDNYTLETEMYTILVVFT